MVYINEFCADSMKTFSYYTTSFIANIDIRHFFLLNSFGNEEHLHFIAP